MSQPNLLHPVWITFELLDRDNTVYDKYAREPVGQAIRDGESPRTVGEQVRIKAQFSEYFASAKHDMPLATRKGIDQSTFAYVALRYKDMLRAGLITFNTTTGVWEDQKIKEGDRVVKVARTAMNLYVTGFKIFAHYPEPGGTMLQVDLEDRHPVDQQGNL